MEDHARSGRSDGALIHQAMWISSLSVKSRLFLDVVSHAAFHRLHGLIHEFSTETDSFSRDGAFERGIMSSFGWMDGWMIDPAEASRWCDQISASTPVTSLMRSLRSRSMP